MKKGRGERTKWFFFSSIANKYSALKKFMGLHDNAWYNKDIKRDQLFFLLFFLILQVNLFETNGWRLSTMPTTKHPQPSTLIKPWLRWRNKRNVSIFFFIIIKRKSWNERESKFITHLKRSRGLSSWKTQSFHNSSLRHCRWNEELSKDKLINSLNWVTNNHKGIVIMQGWQSDMKNAETHITTFEDNLPCFFKM